jgi:hypothetical protein
LGPTAISVETGTGMSGYVALGGQLASDGGVVDGVGRAPVEQAAVRRLRRITAVSRFTGSPYNRQAL